MPTIEKRVSSTGEVSWRARVRRTGELPISKTFARKTDAAKWAKEIETRADQGFAIPSRAETTRTLGVAIDRWIEDRLPDLAESDRKNAKAIALRWKKECGHLTLTRVSPEIVETTARKLRDETDATGKALRGPQRVNRYVATLSRIMGYSQKTLRWVAKNPCNDVRRSPENTERVRFLTTEEVKLLLAAVDAQVDRRGMPKRDFQLFVRVALFTGARRGEVAKLKWRDVDIEGARITFRETKNGASRTVPMPGVLTECVRAYREFTNDRPIDLTDKIFRHDYGFDWRQVRGVLPNFRFHDTRHNVASQLAMAGASLLDIAAVTGHKTLAMVKRYSHLSDLHVRDKLEQAAARIAPHQTTESP